MKLLEGEKKANGLLVMYYAGVCDGIQFNLAAQCVLCSLSVSSLHMSSITISSKCLL